ncbi:tripartite tricarboxylate transporter substrate binding protein [Ancylobacter terrae]|uniref:tripartite tricarboxylate transporter substrate binding protein n=1 Tax=Ancylobacter sp. sgz301288 TaxID=3342077 RepID=UPI00385AA0D8
MSRALCAALVLAASIGCGGNLAAQEFSIIAPAAPGGGWDQTARAMQAALQANGIAKNVQVMNIPGAGGTVGLAQFVAQSTGNPNAFILGGYGMVAPIIANKTAVSLKDVTPIARLTGENEVIVVPPSSPFKTLADLVAALKENPGAVSWAGGSAGGIDHVAASLIAKAVGVDPTKVNYVAFSGGGEALSAILGGQVSVGISGTGEFEALIRAGKLRALGVTAATRIPTVDAPTLKEQGVDVDFQNWRMVAAAPGLTPAQKLAVTEAMTRMVQSEDWKKTLAAKGWQDTFLAGEAFDRFLAAEIAQTETVLKDLGLAK